MIEIITSENDDNDGRPLRKTEINGIIKGINGIYFVRSETIQDRLVTLFACLTHIFKVPGATVLQKTPKI